MAVVALVDTAEGGATRGQHSLEVFPLSMNPIVRTGGKYRNTEVEETAHNVASVEAADFHSGSGLIEGGHVTTIRLNEGNR